MEEYERAENERMEWERDNDEYESVGDRAAAHDSPAAFAVPLVHANLPAERNANEQVPAFSPSRPYGDAITTPTNHD
jgi:hypothetical protein